MLAASLVEVLQEESDAADGEHEEGPVHDALEVREAGAP